MRIVLIGFLACGRVHRGRELGRRRAAPAPTVGRTLKRPKSWRRTYQVNGPNPGAASTTVNRFRQGDRRPVQGQPAGGPQLGTGLRAGTGACPFSPWSFLGNARPGGLRGSGRSPRRRRLRRFRSDFLAGGLGAGGRPFRDPSAAVLELLGQLQAIDNVRRNVSVHESLVRLLQERTQGESSGLNRLDVDNVATSMARARQRLAEEIRQFRDRLDEIKVALGLSPHAAVILDRQSLAGFRAVFESVEDWARGPQRNPQALPRLVERLPALGEVVLDGQPIFAKIETNPDIWEDVLATATGLAIKNRVDRDSARPPLDAGVQLELRVRRRIRIFETTEGL